MREGHIVIVRPIWKYKVTRMTVSIAAFHKAITSCALGKNLKVQLWQGAIRRSSHLIEISTKPRPSVLYVKISNSKPGFWGLTKNQLDNLEQNKVRWFAVLLARSSNSGYLFTSDDVNRLIKDRIFEFSDDGDYKVNEKPDCEMNRAFQGIDTVLDRIL